MLADLEEDLSLPVDLVTTGSLYEDFLNEIGKEELLLYEDSAEEYVL